VIDSEGKKAVLVVDIFYYHSSVILFSKEFPIN